MHGPGTLRRALLAGASLMASLLATSVVFAAACPSPTTLDIYPAGPCTGILASADSTRTWPAGAHFITQEDILTTTGTTTAVRIVGGNAAVQVDGAATSITGTVQRSVDGGVTWANATTSTVTGDPATFIAPILITEQGIAWYRVNVTALTGTPANISITGRTAQ